MCCVAGRARQAAFCKCNLEKVLHCLVRMTLAGVVWLLSHGC